MRSLSVHHLVALALAVACGDATPAGPTNFTVLYTLDASGPVAVDSLRYDDGHGTLVKVASPPGAWTASLTVTSGGSVQALAWVTASGAGSVKLKVSWTVPGVSTQADSSFASPAAPQHFTLSIAHRILY